MSTSVAGYTLLRKLGAGGQGEVWLARDNTRQQDVALKLVPAPGGRSDPVWIALEQEYGISRLLDHPGVLKVERPIRDGDTAILPMEFAVGGDLRSLRGSSYLEIVPVLIEIAQALEHAHEHSIVHRDLKPGNVLRGSDQRIRLSDFGLNGGVSPFTASPQQLEGKPPAVADDVYGLGALAYELLGGYPPYHPHFDLKRAIEGPVPALKPVHQTPAPLLKLIERMLARDPKDRPRTMRQVIDAFDAALNDTLICDPVKQAPVATPAMIAANLTLPTPEALIPRPTRPAPFDIPPRPRSPTPPAKAEPAVSATSPPPETEAAPRPPPPPLVPPPAAVAAPSMPPPPASLPLSPPLSAPEPLPSVSPAPFESTMYVETKLPSIDPVHWNAIRVEHAPTLMRIEPVRTRGWIPALILIVLSALGFAWFNWPGISHAFDDLPRLPALVGEPVAPQEPALAAFPKDEPVEETARADSAQFEQQLAALNARGAGVWGGPEFAAAQAHAAEGAAALGTGDLDVAAPRYKEALVLLDIVAKRAPSALSAELSNGDRALESGQGELARQAYELARRIDPRSKRAEDGLRRARNLGGVLPLLADGANAEAARNFPRAVQDYSQALALDPDNEKAKAGLARANSAFGADTYAKAVGTGFAALGAGRLEEARVAFENARVARPNGGEAAEGLGRVGAALRARGFASARSRAASYEIEERWRDALQEYQQALQLDASLSFAQAGRDRAIARGDLSERLDGMIAHPERLADAGIRNEVGSLLNQARAADPSGPILRSQIARLEILIAQYDKPVRLALLSDNATQVAIQRVGFFGAFSRREVQLKPGRYTVVGTRAGFRDVRRDVTVAPGQDLQSVSVSCIEPI